MQSFNELSNSKIQCDRTHKMQIENLIFLKLYVSKNSNYSCAYIIYLSKTTEISSILLATTNRVLLIKFE